MITLELHENLVKLPPDVVGRYVRFILATMLPEPPEVTLPTEDIKRLRAEGILPDNGDMFGFMEENDSATPHMLVNMWNTMGEPFPKVIKLTGDRMAKARSRIGELPSKTDWETIFARLKESDWHRGKNNTGWIATFDWLIRNSTIPLRILERATCRTTVAAAMRSFSQQPSEPEEPSLSRL